MTMHMNVKGRTETYLRALRTLRDLMETQGSDALSRALAEVVADEHREAFAKSRGLKQSNGRCCIQRLVGGQCDSEDCVPPAGDHDTLWLKDGRPALYLAQPYQLTWREMQELVEFCSRRGLKADVTAWPSFHFPGHVLSIHIEKAKTEEDAPSAEGMTTRRDGRAEQQQPGDIPGGEKS